jgi:PBP1b-binding outer membrane lipoprotein LpoB
MRRYIMIAVVAMVLSGCASMQTALSFMAPEPFEISAIALELIKCH